MNTTILGTKRSQTYIAGPASLYNLGKTSSKPFKQKDELLTQNTTMPVNWLIAHKALTRVIVTRAEVQRAGTIQIDSAWIGDLTSYAFGVVGRHPKSGNTLTRRGVGIAEAIKNNRRTVGIRRALVADPPLDALSAVCVWVETAWTRTQAVCIARTVEDSVAAVRGYCTCIIDSTHLAGCICC